MDEMSRYALGALAGAHMLLAAGIDARSRVFPQGLAVSFALVCIGYAVVAGGFSRLLLGVVLAAMVCGSLVAFEMFWRRTHGGASGLGMGDVKFLFAFVIASPFVAMASFALGLLGLAVVGALLKRTSLPLLPFVVAATPLVLLAA